MISGSPAASPAPVPGARGPRPREWVFLAAALVMGVIFCRLGVWQLQRLGERRARNAQVMQRLALPAVPLAALPRDSAEAHYRRARVSGTYDFAHEVLFINRIRDGAPGVHLVTPVIPDSRTLGDTAVLVDRGWVYSPDAATVDATKWREPTHVDGAGYIQEYVRTGQFPAAMVGHPDRFRWLDPAVLSLAVGHPVGPYYVVLDTEPDLAIRHLPQRIPTPPLDEGPHLSYAIQWFAFAAIAVVGAVIVVFVLPRRRPA